MEAFLFDGWLDGGPWRVQTVTCGCGRTFIAVHRADRAWVCVYCTITDRAKRIRPEGA